MSRPLPRCFVLALLWFPTPAVAARPHPEPRVIVTVESVEGPHERAAVERAAREGWGRIVRCYKTHARGERGDTRLELTIAAAGRVDRAKATRTIGSNPELSACLADSMKGLAMPKAERHSMAQVNVWVAPGDAS